VDAHIYHRRWHKRALVCASPSVEARIIDTYLEDGIFDNRVWGWARSNLVPCGRYDLCNVFGPGARVLLDDPVREREELFCHELCALQEVVVVLRMQLALLRLELRGWRSLGDAINGTVDRQLPDLIKKLDPYLAQSKDRWGSRVVRCKLQEEDNELVWQ
jgi:hypothetical protein